MNEKFEQIRDKIVQTKLVISRVPKNTRERFLVIASDDEFCGDYGMALKFLVDLYMGLVPTGLEHVEQEIQLLKTEVSQLRNSLEQKDDKKMMNGRSVKR